MNKPLNLHQAELIAAAAGRCWRYGNTLSDLALRVEIARHLLDREVARDA